MISLYVHIPFCAARCAYCDFNTYAGQEDRIPAYVQALCFEIEQVSGAAPERLAVPSFFFGGGTPSLLSSGQFERILRTFHDRFGLRDAEGTIEANPGTVSLGFLRDLHRMGVNRLSLGVQSADPQELKQLGRIHDYPDVIRSVEAARRAGFENLNLDLIYALPGQGLARWLATLRAVLALEPEHLSLYALTIEPATPFGRWAARGLLPTPDPDLAADMLEAASERLAAAGYQRYEISNWARPGRECLHNLSTWRNEPYLGFGAGAHGCAQHQRMANVRRIPAYLERCRRGAAPAFPNSPAQTFRHRLTEREEMQETMMLSLRLTHEGVSYERFRARFGLEMTSVFAGEIDELLHLGLLEQAEAGTRLRLTARGAQVGNQAFLRFVD
jgi:oxygen-independent coproporphyrinogen-3 oxidase